MNFLFLICLYWFLLFLLLNLSSVSFINFGYQISYEHDEEHVCSYSEMDKKQEEHIFFAFHFILFTTALKPIKIT